MTNKKNPSLQLNRTPEQKLTSKIIQQSLSLGEKPSGTTTKLRYGFATLYSTYRFKFRKYNKYYISRDYVGTSTTNKGQNAVQNYSDLIRGAYINAVYQFREENNVGSKGFSAIHIKSELKYWEKNTVDSGQRITESDVIKYNPEKINFIMNKEEYIKKENKKSRIQQARDIVTNKQGLNKGIKNKKQKQKLAIETAGYVRIKKKTNKHTKKTIKHTKRKK